MELPAYLRDSDRGAELLVQAVPGAKRTEIRGEYGDRLKIALNAPPEDGRANEELVTFLAKRCKTPAELVHGASSRRKTVRFPGISAADVAQRITSE